MILILFYTTYPIFLFSQILVWPSQRHFIALFLFYLVYLNDFTICLEEEMGVFNINCANLLYYRRVLAYLPWYIIYKMAACDYIALCNRLDSGFYNILLIIR